MNFLFLLIIVLFLVKTNSFVGLVMGYELLFLPSLLIMRKTVYSSSAQSAYSVFTVWSVIGSLIVVSAAMFVITKTGDHTFSNIKDNIATWTDRELLFLSFLIFVGFGVKIPVWPFHYWLTRVHVEASTGFSIFLSGFLVKAAVFVCWKTMYGFGLTFNNPIFICICLFSVLDGVFKLSAQTDLKKLVAFATVFEMGLLYLFLVWKPVQSVSYVFIFAYSHAFLSGLMFFLVEVLYRRTQTRSIDAMAGLVVFFPSLSKAIWSMLFVFWGLPFTIKFFIEIWVLLSFFQTNSYWLFFYIIFTLSFANIVVTKVWLQILYGSPVKKLIKNDMTTWEWLVVFYCFAANTIPFIFFSVLGL